MLVDISVKCCLCLFYSAHTAQDTSHWCTVVGTGSAAGSTSSRSGIQRDNA